MPTEETGPATLNAVKHRANVAVDDHDDDDDLLVIVAAVNDLVSGLPVAQGQDGTDDKPWRARVVLGANMLGARLFGRRNSPNGIEGFGVDGALYVRRNDPDVALLLQLGDYAKPGVG